MRRLFGSRGSSSKAPPTVVEGEVAGFLHEDGQIECRTCGTQQAYTHHVCIECGADPWAESTWGSPGGAAEPSAPPLPASGGGGGGGQGTGSYSRSESALSEVRLSESYEALASEHAECPICFEPLCSAPLALFSAANGRRVCWHIFHETCARQLAGVNLNCPLCRADFNHVTAVPRIDTDPNAWFDACDMDGNNALSTREVLEIVKSSFPVDHTKLERDLPKLWRRWDPNGDGHIQRHEFLAPNGLLDFLRDHFPKQTGRHDDLPVPDIRSDKQAWFRHFDEDGSGELSISEVTRGLIKSYHLSSDVNQAQAMRDLVTNVWCLFDADQSGEISQAEFLHPGDGLADSIIASYGH